MLGPTPEPGPGNLRWIGWRGDVWEQLCAADVVVGHAEDTDFAGHAAAAGATLVWVGGTGAHHQYHPPSRECPARQRELVRNARLFHERHGWFPMADWLTALAEDGVVEFAPDRGVLRWR